MRLTTKGRFAVTAMIDLALRQNSGPVTLAAISQRQQISLSYLEQLFGKLRRNELVESTRGPGGGYTLGRKAVDHFPIYMDYGATTPCDPRVVDVMIPWLREHFGNPASRSHAWGWEAEKAVEKARGTGRRAGRRRSAEIVWTSGATESNNLAIKGAAHFYKSKGKHLITVKTEHKAVLDTMRELERQGFEVTYLDVQETACSTSSSSRRRCGPTPSWPR
jgi:selenocysteine lyase/cysteine desulfurase